MKVKKRELDDAMAKIYDECGQLKAKFHKEEEERCSPCEWKREDGDSYLKREAYDRVKKATDDYYIQLLDERTVRIPKDMIIITEDNKTEHNSYHSSLIRNESDRVNIADMKESLKTMAGTVKVMTDVIEKAEKAFEEKEQRDGYIGMMEGMFKRYVATEYPSKRFEGSNIIGTGGYEENSMRISYNYDGVNMSYLGRRTHHNGDYDWFVDKNIYVDGLNILNEVKQ